MRLKVPKGVYYGAVATVCLLLVFFAALYWTLVYTHQPVPPEMVDWMKLLVGGLLIVVVPRESASDAPPPGPDAASNPDSKGDK